MATSKSVSRTIKLYIDNQEIDGSVKSIKSRIRELTAEMNKLTVGTEEYEAKAKKIRELNGILASHRQNIRGVAHEMDGLSGRFGKLADGFNRYMGLVGGAVASLTGLTMTVRKTVDEYAKMQEAEAQVQKYTGMTADEVERLNEDFKKMDTRTSREQLNALAGDAGRLGITSAEAIKEFVDGADKIRVALGDDLGENAVRDIGKLAQMFGEDKKKGLRGAMLATGSAINELAQNSSASADAIVQFTARLSGVAQQAGLTQAQIMGIGSVMDQNMQEIPTSATVISQLITKMMQDTGRFAALAGQDVKEFSDLLRNDANKALITFLNAMKARGGFADMAKMFDEMKMDGSRAVGVLSALAGHLDQLAEAQDLATKSYEEGTSVIKEFNVQNNTVQAQLDKAKKKFQDLSIELGEKLMPIARYGITTGSAMVKILMTIIDFVSKWRTTLIAVTLAIAAYNAQMLLSMANTKLWIPLVVKLREAFAALWTIMQKNPMAAAATAAVLLYAALNDIVRAFNSASESAKAFKNATEEAAGAAELENAKLQVLINTIRSSTASEEDRKKALEELNGKVMAAHLGNLTEEQVRTRDLTRLLSAYNAQLERSVKLRVLDKEMEQLVEKERGELKKVGKDPATWVAKNIFGKDTSELEEVWQERIKKRFQKEREALVKEINNINNTPQMVIANPEPWRDNGYTNFSDDGLPPITPGSGGGGSGGKGKKGKGSSAETIQRKAVRAELLKIDAEYTAKQNELRKQFVNGEIASTEELNARIQELELERLNKVLEVANLEPAKREETAKKILEMRVGLKEELDKILEEMNEGEEESYEKKLKKLEENLRLQESVLKQSLNNQLITQEQYNEQLEKVRNRNAAQQAEIRQKEAEKQFALMEKVHEQELIALERNHYEQQTSENDFEEKKREAEKKFLQQVLDTMELSAEKRQELQNEIDNFELEAAKKKYDKQIARLNTTFNTMQDVAQQFGQEWGTMMQTFFDSGELQFGEFLGNLLKLTIDALEKAVIAAIAERTISNIATLGFVGLAKAAAEIAAITAAFETAKAAVMSFDTGGFTGPGRNDETKGIVHANEFVANRYATGNRALAPVLNLIDQAQRSGSVQNLTAEDVAAVLPTTQTTINHHPSSSTQPNIQAALLATLATLNGSTANLVKRLERPIIAETYVTGKRGVNEAQSLEEKMRSNVSRG